MKLSDCEPTTTPTPITGSEKAQQEYLRGKEDFRKSVVSLIEARAREWEALMEKTRGNVPHERYKPTIDTLRELAKQIGEMKP